MGKIIFKKNNFGGLSQFDFKTYYNIKYSRQ